MNGSKEGASLKNENDIKRPLKVDSNGQAEDRTSVASLNSDSDYHCTFESFQNGHTGNEPTSTGTLAKFEVSCDSDDSYWSQATGGSEENCELNLQVCELASNGKEKKKKSSRKLAQMKKMIKKTFSDADATPDGDGNVDWKKTTTPEENNASFPRKTKSKRYKSVPFNDELQILSPSYKQKNDAFHKIFKQLPEEERLLVDCTCAFIKDILVQGRLYVSQNYVCFHSNILKWQTVVTIEFKDVELISKVKTAKVFPNAIQFQVKGREKSPTFSSFTQRDRTHQQITKLWQNALADKPISPKDLWHIVRSHYGVDLGYSSEDDDVKPATRINGLSFTAKEKGNKKVHKTIDASPSSSNTLSVEDHSTVLSKPCQSSEDSKSSCQESVNESAENSFNEEGEAKEEKDGDAGTNDDVSWEHCKECLRWTYMEREFPVSASFLFQTIFEGTCDFWNEFLKGKGSHDIVIENWRSGSDDHEGDQVRNLSYNLPLNNPLVPKSLLVEEMQVLYKESVASSCYAVDAIARTHGVPYSEYFSSVMRYSIRKLTRTTCEMRVSAQIKFHKTPWGLVKNFIEKNVHNGMDDNFQLLERELTLYLKRVHRPQSLPALAPTPVPESHKPAPSAVASETCQDVDSSRTLTKRSEVTAAPSTAPFAIPSDLNNNGIYSKPFQSRTETSSGKWIFYLCGILLVLLLWSNYSMYNRLNTLEELHARYSTDDMREVHTNDRFISHDDVVAKGFRFIDVRLASVEKLIRNLTIASDQQWTAMNREWKRLHKRVATFIGELKENEQT